MTSVQASTIPEPTEIKRDEDGRVVGLVIDSSWPLPPHTENTWLVAIDGSAHARRTAAEAARLSRGMLHLMNVQPWLSKEAAETELARRGWEATTEARATLDAVGHAWRLHVAMGDSAECIVALAKHLGCHGVVIGSRGLGTAETLLIGSVAYKVIHLSPVSVLVVR